MVEATRRDRVRAATLREITSTARRLLVDEGPKAVTLRAIAREMGMTAPALYRYFDSHDELVEHVTADIVTELCDGLDAAIAAAPPGDPTARIVAACREFRRWAFAHPREFRLVFGTPLSEPGVPRGGVLPGCIERFGGTFATLFAGLYLQHHFPVPAPDEIAPALRADLEKYQQSMPGPPLPVGAVLVFLQCWSRLYGMVVMELFGHLDFALTDTEPMFEYMLADFVRMLGLPPPADAAGQPAG